MAVCDLRGLRHFSIALSCHRKAQEPRLHRFVASCPATQGLKFTQKRDMMRLTTFILFAATTAFAQTNEKLDRRGEIARGKYFVEQAAMCVECHTPRDGSGRLLRDKYLEGAPVPVKSPPYANFKWAIRAPAIAGLPGYTVEQGVRLLTEGITADNRRPDPPMPRFRFSRADAEAIVAYLKSLQ